MTRSVPARKPIRLKQNFVVATQRLTELSLTPEVLNLEDAQAGRLGNQGTEVCSTDEYPASEMFLLLLVLLMCFQRIEIVVVGS